MTHLLILGPPGASTMLFTWRPSGVPFLMLYRKMSPVEIAGMPKARAGAPAWVPLPARAGRR